MPIKLLIADHQQVMRAGLEAMIARSDVKVVAEAKTEREAIRLAGKHKPNVVILDVRFAGEDGFTTLGRLRKKYPDLPVLMWSTGDNPTYIARAMAIGAWGYLPRSVGRKELLAAIRTVAGGKKAWTQAELDRFTGNAEVPEGAHVPLTPRERDVVRQLSYGLSNKELALALDISYETIKEHVQHLLRKLNMKDRTQAAVWAIRTGID